MHGRLLPTSCTNGKTFPEDSCRLSCRRGFRPASWVLSALGSERKLRCTSALSWNAPDVANRIMESCIKAVFQPFIKCPSGGEMEVALPPGEKVVTVKIPRPESNVDWWR